MRGPARTRAFLLTATMLSVCLSAGFGRAELGGPKRVAPRSEVESQLAAIPPGQSTLVLVSGDTTRRALTAVRAAGMTPVEVFERFGLVAATGSPEAVRAVHFQPGVLRVDANQRIERFDDLAHRSTGVAQLRDAETFPELADLRRADGSPFDGTGVSIAVVDSGFDATHEQFVEAGDTKFDVHLRQACPVPGEVIEYAVGVNPSQYCSLWVPMTAVPDPDHTSGHGTLVAATAAGYARTSPGGTRVSGVAPGARLVGLSTGASDVIYNAFSALNWVLEHHADPCGDGSCPPIGVVNNSYGLAADDDVFTRRFDPDSPMSRVTTALVEDGVVVVFAAGNDGGDGTKALTNFIVNPVPGFLMVGAYHDANVGDPNMLAAHLSARGKKGERATYPDLLAPGQNVDMGCAPGSLHCIASEGPEGDGAYGMFSGTSLSAPYVAGVVAQLLDADPSLTPAQIEDVLEDTAHQLGRPGDLEPDLYVDPAGNTRGNDDHLTTFDAGHGNVDAVGALAEVLQRPARIAPDLCPRSSSVSFADPDGDTRLAGLPPGVVDVSGHDVLGVTASLDAEPGALSVVLAYRDLPDVSTVPMHTTVVVAADRGGDLGSGVAELDLDRTLAGDSFSVFRGEVTVEGAVDPTADTVTFLIRPTGGDIDVRATFMWAWTATENRQLAELDDTGGSCTLWLSPA